MTAVSRGEITITNVNDGKTPYFHTAYTNSTDFGNYDYSGRPNLAPNISFYELSSSYRQYVSPRSYIKDEGKSFVIDKSLAIAASDSPNVYIKNVPRLEKGVTYIASVPLFIDDDYTINNNHITIDTYCVATADGTIKRLGRVQPDENCRNKWHNYTVAFSVPSDFSDGDFTPFMQIWEAKETTGKINIGYDIKIERVSSASDKPTPYQPNIKDSPWYFSTVPLGENIADPTVKFPITLSKEALYAKNASEDFVLGETYTVTIKATKPASQTIRVYLGQKQFGVFKPVEGLTDTWVATVSITRLGENPKWVYLDQTPNTSLGTVQIDWLKIEKGDTRTPNIDSYKYLGNYTDFIQAGSINPTKYSWNLIKGTPSYFHTAYTNDLNFGSYDFSGRPNLMGTIKASDFYLGTGTTMTDISTNSIHVASKGTERMDAGTRINIPNLVSGKTYTISAKIKVDEGSTGDVDKIRVSYRKTPDGTILLSTTAYTAEVGKEITVQSTGTVNYSITDLQRFYLTIDLEGYSSRLNGGVTVSEIKIEEGSPATPYQPNIKGAPWHFSKTALGGDIANKNTQFPIKTSEYCIYGRNNIEKYVVNQNYTVTMKVTKPASQQLVAYIDGGRTKAGNFLPVEGLVDVWKTTFTITQAHIDSGITDVLQIYQFPSETKGAVQIEWLKIEKGSESTPNIDSYKYLGSYVNFDQADLLNPTKYSWNLIKGSDGKPAKTLILSASSNTVKINQDSSIQSDTITLQANMQNMVGTATFSATPYIGTTPQTAITLGGAGNIRTLSTSSWNKNWTSLVVTATFESFIDKQTIISVKEGKDGTDSVTGLLTNESVTLAADKNGTVESFSEASGTFKVFDGLSDVTGRNVAYRLKSSLGGTFNINASTGAYSMTAMSKDSATATFEATYKNIKIEKILNIAKSKAGKETYTYTKYSNSKDFGSYDYNGNPNLMIPLKASDFNKELETSVSDVGYNSIRLTSKGSDRLSTSTLNNIPSLVRGKTYTISAKVKIEEGTTGNIDKVRVCYRKINSGTILLHANTKGVEVGKETTIKGTGVVNYEITDLSRFYLTIDTEVGAKINGSVIVSDIKIEEGPNATPYQPNLLDAPYYLSKVPLGKNLITNGDFPITSFSGPNGAIYFFNISEEIIIGETYTISLKGTKTANKEFHIYLGESPNWQATLSPVEGLTDVWSATFKANNDNQTSNLRTIALYQKPDSVPDGSVKIDWFKIEKVDTRTPNIDSYKYMGIYVGGESEQPHDPTQYAWSQIKGNDSTSYSLLLSSQVMSLPRGASKLVPENITISGMAQTGEKSIENIRSRIVVEETTNGTTWTTKYDADALTYTYTPSSLNVLSARVKMYVAGAKNVQLDQKSINIVKDGSNGSNGSSSYTWIRYSENANGNPMTTTPNSKTKYIGIAITQTSTAPSAYGDYTWSKIKGDGGLKNRLYTETGTNVNQKPVEIFNETQSDGDIVEPENTTWYVAKESSNKFTAIGSSKSVNLVRNSSDEWSTPVTSFTGINNYCPTLSLVDIAGLKIGDKINVYIEVKYDNIVAASGQTASFYIQGSGNNTGWSSGGFPSNFTDGRLRNVSGSGSVIFKYSTTITSAHLENNYWNTQMRCDYIQSGSIQWKNYKIEKSLTGKGGDYTPWTPAPGQGNQYYFGNPNLVSQDQGFNMIFHQAGANNVSVHTEIAEGGKYPRVDTSKLVKIGEVLPSQTIYLNGIETGKTYTQSIIVATDAPVDLTKKTRFTWFNSDGHRYSETHAPEKIGPNLYKFTNTYTAPVDIKNLRVFDFYPTNISFASGTYIEFRTFKIEEGSNATMHDIPTMDTLQGILIKDNSIVISPSYFLEENSITFRADVDYQTMRSSDQITITNKAFDAMRPLILRQPVAPQNPYPGLLWLDTSSGSGDPLDKTNPSLVYRWGKSAVENVIGTEYAHCAYANTPTGYQEDGVTPDPSFSVTYNSSQKPMYIGHCVTDTEPDPTTPSSYNWKSITTENGSEDVNGARGIAQEKTETTYAWGWVVLSASDLEMLPWLNNEDGSTIIDWIYQITQKTSDDSIIQTVVGSEDMSKVYAKTDAVDELSSANHELSDKLEEYNKQMEDAFAGIDTTYVNKSEFEQEMNKFNFGIDKAGGVNLIRNSTGFQWEDTAPSDEMLANPKFEGTISTTGLNNGWVYNATGIGQVIGAESDFPENKIMRIGGTNSPTKYSYSKNVPVSPGQLINISGQVRIPNTIGNTKNAYLSIRFYAAGSDPSFNAASQTIGSGQGVITLFTDKTDFAGTIFETDSYAVKTNNIVQDIWSNYSVNVTIPPGAAFMKVLLYNDSTTPTNYFDFRKPSVVLYSGMFDFWHKNDSANAQIRQILGDESLEELGLIAGFELKGLRYKLDQDILLPNPNTEYTLSWYANKISQSGMSKYYVKVLNTKTGAEIAVSEASADTIGYQRMSVTFSVTNTSAVTIRIGLEGEGSADATLSAAGLMINIGPYPLSWQSHHEEVYSTNVRIDSSGLKVFNSDYDGYNVMTPREFAGYYRNGEVYERVFTLNKDTTKVKKLEAQERFMMRPVQIVSVDSPTIQGWAFVGYNGEDTD